MTELEVNEPAPTQRRWLPFALVGVLVAAGVGVGLWQGGVFNSRTDYPANIQTNFLNSCESTGGNVSQCDCTLHWMEDNVSLQRFQALEAEVNSGGYPDEVSQAIAACS